MDEVKIGYYPFTIVEQDHIMLNNEIADGMIDHDEMKILLQSGMVPPKRLRVLFHELIHGISDIYNVVLTEEEVDILAIATATFVVDNLSFLKDLLNSIERNKESFPLRSKTIPQKKPSQKSVRTIQKKNVTRKTVTNSKRSTNIVRRRKA